MNKDIIWINHKKTEEYKRHREMLDRFEKMSDKEKLQTFIEVGIYNEKGELTERYGGTAPNKKKEEDEEPFVSAIDEFRKEGKIEVAINLLKEGVEMSIICKVTGLTEEEILKQKEKLCVSSG